MAKVKRKKKQSNIQKAIKIKRKMPLGDTTNKEKAKRIKRRLDNKETQEDKDSGIPLNQLNKKVKRKKKVAGAKLGKTKFLSDAEFEAAMAKSEATGGKEVEGKFKLDPSTEQAAKKMSRRSIKAKKVTAKRTDSSPTLEEGKRKKLQRAKTLVKKVKRKKK